MPDVDVPLTTGFLLKGRYLIERELGRGGVGLVLFARDQQLLSRPVVIKVLLEDAYRDEWIKTKFRQEMEALARIDHPGIVSLLDSGELPDGRMFLVLQFIHGVTLRSLMSPEGMSLPRAAAFIRNIAAALEAAHNQGVLHRDLKPENIMIPASQGEEQIKIIDFGLAKIERSQIAESTVTPTVAGSYAYMSPEQLTARPVTAASDVYSLGVIAYELITGRRPHNPNTMFELLEMLRAGVRDLPRDLRPSLPIAAQDAILKALQFDPAARFQDARTFGEDLWHALETAENRAPSPASSISVSGKHAERERIPIRSVAAASSLALLSSGILFWTRASFFRFHSWTAFLVRPETLLLLLSLGAGTVLLALYGQRYLSRFGVAGCSLLTAVFWYFSFSLAPPVRVVQIQGNPAEVQGHTLNYSDPRGYRYTMQQNSYFRVDLDPGRFNQINSYRLSIMLSPELEFSDIYLDRRFGIDDQLSLDPNATVDVLVLEQENDSFDSHRDILFTCKSRNPPDAVRLSVTLQTEGVSYTYAF